MDQVMDKHQAVDQHGAVDQRRQVLEKIAHEYHTNEAIPDIHIENLCQDHFITWLLKQLSKSDRVLELGYGDGLVTAALAGLGCDLTVIEGASTLVNVAKAKHPNINCIDTLFEEFRPEKPYDVILASHVLEHVDNPQDILKLMASWLSDDGELIIVVPNKNSIHRQLSVIMGLQPQLDTLSARDLLVGHQRVYSLQTLEDDVRGAGLFPIESMGFFLKVLPNSMMLDYSKALLKALNEISDVIPKDILANIGLIVSKKPLL
ncbi:MAG TPA: class I SAM-dependent methyltransferase [Methylophilaceae bacterium]|jgi:2-polyprenyl-3-methyl-5-hydroxy-6-metoxy-1,4-benzoquinol methylase